MELNVGAVIAEKYRIQRLLGEGGMGSVYLATNTVLERDVALKVMNERFASNASAAMRFQREAVAASRVSHPSIVQVYDAGIHGGLPWIAMEMLEGESLGERLLRGPLSEAELMTMASGVLPALSEVHEQGLLHRDLKPDNIFLATRKGQDGFVPKILDFGIAKDTNQQLDKLTATGAVIGTAYYLSPEQAKGLPDLDARTDIYSFGVVLYESLSGQMPFEAQTLTQLIAKIFTEAPRPLRSLAPRVPGPISDAIHLCLETDRDQRFQSARALLSALEQAAGAASANPGLMPTALAPAHPAPSAVALATGSTAPLGAEKTPELAPLDSTSSAMSQAAPLPSSTPTRVAEASPPTPRSERGASTTARLILAAAVFALGAAAVGGMYWATRGGNANPHPTVATAESPSPVTVPAPLPPPAADGPAFGAALVHDAPPGRSTNARPPVTVDGSRTASPPSTSPSEGTPAPVAEPSPSAIPEESIEAPPAQTPTAGVEPPPTTTPAPEATATATEPIEARAGDSPPTTASPAAPPLPPPAAAPPSSSPAGRVAPEVIVQPRRPQPRRPPTGLTPQQINEALAPQRVRIHRRCYERRAARVRGLRGVVTIDFGIGAAGRVQHANVIHNSTGDEWMGNCVRNVVRRTRFPASRNGQATPARLPFTFP